MGRGAWLFTSEPREKVAALSLAIPSCCLYSEACASFLFSELS